MGFEGIRNEIRNEIRLRSKKYKVVKAETYSQVDSSGRSISEEYKTVEMSLAIFPYQSNQIKNLEEGQIVEKAKLIYSLDPIKGGEKSNQIEINDVIIIGDEDFTIQSLEIFEQSKHRETIAYKTG